MQLPPVQVLPYQQPLHHGPHYGPQVHGYAPLPPYGGAHAHQVHAVPPANFVSPSQALPLRLESHKHRDSVAAAITRRMGGTTKDVGTPIYQGPSITTPAELTHKQDPLMFCDRLAGAFKMAGMGVLALEPDVPTAAGASYVMKGWPDEHTSVRLNILFPMLPSTMAVTSTISRGTDAQVHNLNGGMTTVAFEHFHCPGCPATPRCRGCAPWPLGPPCQAGFGQHPPQGGRVVRDGIEPPC